jgi:riboflavin kinase/FMN adenylyltransferase
LIAPELTGFGFTDFNKAQIIEEKGLQAVNLQNEKFNQLKQLFQNSSSSITAFKSPVLLNEKMQITAIKVVGNKVVPSKIIAKEFDPLIKHQFDANEVSNAINELYKWGDYEKINYQLNALSEQSAELQINIEQHTIIETAIDASIKLLKEEFPLLKKIVVGFDFCFGKDRKYCIEKLKELFDGEVLVIDEIKIDNIPVHSRIIRDYLKAGDIKMANKLLGKQYKIYGQKIVGQGLGAKSFVPTINLKVNEFLLPNEGVYITKTILDELEFDSITFLGHRLTTDGSYAVETHILNKDIENKDYKTQIKFCQKLRENKKFDTFEKLKNQIINDIKSANNYFINIY